jgi:hypothetical protein
MIPDFIWLIIGTAFGYILCLNNRKDDVPKNLEECTTDRSKLEQDVLYYKKLTRSLVEENRELRKKINET